MRLPSFLLTLLPLLAVPALGSAPDLLIVGAGISGLSAAAEGARLGLRVTVVDRHSLYGGVAVNAYGVTIINSPLQRQLGIEDSVTLAIGDFVTWGDDPDPHWVRFYAEHSKTELFDWFVERDVKFEKVAKVRGNSVARFHYPRGGIVTMVQALYREIHRIGGVEFAMHSDVTGLVLDQARVIGVKLLDYRSGETRTILAKNVLLATGGFQNNEELVREFWPSLSAKPDRILLGSGLESTGSGLELARSANARIGNLDRQWNYVPGIQIPDDPSATRGVYLDFPGPIWVNTAGRRFVNEGAVKSVKLEALSRQEHSTGWMIFDSTFSSSITLVHPVFNTEPTKTAVLGRPNVLYQAASIVELAEKTGLPATELSETIARYNEGFISGKDDFSRRLPIANQAASSTRPLKEAPYFALKIFPITRKSMGGIQVDSNCRVIDESGMVVPGLYASGEAAGLGGVNGKQSLEGTFIGAAILMGRVAARSIADSTSTARNQVASTPYPDSPSLSNPNPGQDVACIKCHKLSDLTSLPRPGYRHFELSHRIVMERDLSCQMCHAELSPYRSKAHKIDRLAQVGNCNICHSLVQN